MEYGHRCLSAVDILDIQGLVLNLISGLMPKFYATRLHALWYTIKTWMWAMYAFLYEDVAIYIHVFVWWYRSMQVCGGGISDEAMVHLRVLSSITSLNISQNDMITNRCVCSCMCVFLFGSLDLCCMAPHKWRRLVLPLGCEHFFSFLNVFSFSNAAV